MTGVILVIDELIDQGIIMNLDSTTILQRINSKDQPGSEAAPAQSSGGWSLFGRAAAQPAAQEESSGMFASIFAGARG